MKVLLDYDINTQQLSEPSGGMITGWAGLERFEHKDDKAFSSKPSVSELKDLKEAGFEAFEIAEMRKAGLV